MSLESALSCVSLHADSVWWPDQPDPYRLANLGLWQEHLGIQQHRQTSSHSDHQQQQPSEASPGWHWSMQTWSSAGHQRTQPAENMESLPFKIETFEELKLYRKITQESVKNIWAMPEQEKRMKDPSMNANVPEFYPSVIVHEAEYSMQLQPTVDHGFHQLQQTDMFPYREHETTWRHPQVQAFHRPGTQQAPESWYGRSGTCPFPNEYLFQRTPRSPQEHQMRPSVHQLYGGVHQYHQQRQQHHLLLGPDFPELPNARGGDHSLRQGRPLNIPDMYPFNVREEHLQGPYQVRRISRAAVQDNSRLKQSLKGSLEVIPHGSSETRRLYRDVLASKSDEDSQTAIDRRFDELEKEAMEQYISSEDSEAIIGRTTGSDDHFQDLERQAVEQYEDQEQCNVKSAIGENSTKLLLRTQSIVTLRSSAGKKLYLQNVSQPHLLEIDKENRALKQGAVREPVLSQAKRSADLLEGVEESSLVGPVADSAKDTSPKVPDKVEKQLYEKPLESKAYNKKEKITSHDAWPRVSSINEREPMQKQTREDKTVDGDLVSPTTQGQKRGKRRPLSSLGSKRKVHQSPGDPSRPATCAGQRKQRKEARCALDGQGRQKDRQHKTGDITETETHVITRKEGIPKIPIKTQENDKKSCKTVKGSKKCFREDRKREAESPETKVPAEVDAKTLLSRLKIRALNYLRTVDMKLVLEEKEVVRALLYGEDGPDERIRSRVRITDIQTQDVFRAFVKEMAILTKLSTEVIYRRVRREVLEMKNLHLVQPTCAEKRKVRNLIKKCLQLEDKAGELMSDRKIPKKQYESLKKQVAEILNTIHKTMKVVYCLRDMSRDSVIQLEKTSSGSPLLSDLLLEKVLPEPLRSRVIRDHGSLLLQLQEDEAAGVRRRTALLQDRTMAWLDKDPSNLYVSHLDLLVNHNLLARTHDENVLSVKQTRFVSATSGLGVSATSGGGMSETRGWSKVLVIGNTSYPVILQVGGVKDYVCDPELVRMSGILSYFEERPAGETAEESKLQIPYKEVQAER